MSHNWKSVLTPLSEPAATEEQIVAAEHELGAHLPQEYRAFLKQFNGATFSRWLRFLLPGEDPDDDCGYGRLRMIFGVNDQVDGSLVHSQNDYDFYRRVPKSIICISEWNGYFRACLCVRGSARGKVYWWDPVLPWEESEEENVPTRQYLTLVASNFNEFLERLEIDPDF